MSPLSNAIHHYEAIKKRYNNINKTLKHRRNEAEATAHVVMPADVANRIERAAAESERNLNSIRRELANADLQLLKVSFGINAHPGSRGNYITANQIIAIKRLEAGMTIRKKLYELFHRANVTHARLIRQMMGLTTRGRNKKRTRRD
jgi:hypothetical protein